MQYFISFAYLVKNVDEWLVIQCLMRDAFCDLVILFSGDISLNPGPFCKPQMFKKEGKLVSF